MVTARVMNQPYSPIKFEGVRGLPLPRSDLSSMLWAGAALWCTMAASSKKPAGGGGFGAAPKAPPTLREVARTFKSRLPKDASVPCACGSDAAYAECCRPYHKGDAAAETPERLLRTRCAAPKRAGLGAQPSHARRVWPACCALCVHCPRHEPHALRVQLLPGRRPTFGADTRASPTG